LRAQDLSPIYIGTQSNMSLTGPPATIGGGVIEPDPAAAAAMPIAPGAIAPAAPGTAQPGTPTAPSAAPIAPPSPATTQPTTQPPAAPVLPTGSTQRPVVPPGSSPIPGMVPAPTTPVAPPSNVTVFTPPPEPPAAAQPPAQASPAPGVAAQPPPAAPARVTLSPPNEMRVGSGPYTIPISIAAATRISTLTLSITYNPALVRVRNVQEGTFMRQGGATPAFSSQVDEKSGRIDIVITRPGDKTGASAAGLVAALLVEPLTAGTGALSLSGSASVPGGAAAALQLLPVGITIR
ncbi:MAG TPA: cohesin domain-containing protein, partial [Vicinamibacterales bacterium]